MLLNLLSNAVKFTHKGGRVTIIFKIVRNYTDLSLQNEEFEALKWNDRQMIEVQVEDTGVGISQEDQKKPLSFLTSWTLPRRSTPRELARACPFRR